MAMRTGSAQRTVLMLGVVLSIAAVAAVGLYRLRDNNPPPFDPEQHLRLVSTVPGTGVGLPDLVSVAPDPEAVDTINFANTELLVVRFDGRIMNIGPGPLDIYGNPRAGESGGSETDGPRQRIWDGESWTPVERPPIRFESADGHNHFHFMQIARYSLWDSTRSRQIAPSSKVGFCLTDSTNDDPEAERGYFGDDGNYCRQGSPDATVLRMGISPGFSDIYSSDTALQWVDVSDVVPGRYYVAGEVDPFGQVIEADESNNSIMFADTATIVSGHVAQPWIGATGEGEPVSVGLLSDTIGLPGGREIRIVAEPAHGSLSPRISNSDPGITSFLYTPEPGFAGVDRFTFVAADPTSLYPLTPVEAVALIVVGDSASPTLAITGRRSTIHTGGTLHLNIVATAPLRNLDTTWSVDGIVGGSPAAGTIDSDGFYRAPDDPVETVVISRAADNTTASVTFEVTTPPNHRPFIEPPLVYVPLAAAADTQEKLEVTTLERGEPAGFIVPATDPNGDTLVFTASNLPPGLTIDRATGFVSGTPTRAGEYTVTFSADDGTTTSSIDTVLIVD